MSTTTANVPLSPNTDTRRKNEKYQLRVLNEKLGALLTATREKNFELQRLLDSARDRENLLQNELKGMEQQLDTTQTALKRECETVASLESKLISRNQEIEEWRSKCQKKDEEIENLNKKLKAAKVDFDTLSNELDALRNELNKYKETYGGKTAMEYWREVYDKRFLESLNKNQKEHEAATARLAERLEELEEEYKSKLESLGMASEQEIIYKRRFEEQINVIDLKNTELSGRIDELTDLLRKKEHEIQTLKDQIASAEEQADKAKRLATENRTLKADLSQRDARLINLTTQINELRERIKEMEPIDPVDLEAEIERYRILVDGASLNSSKGNLFSPESIGSKRPFNSDQVSRNAKVSSTPAGSASTPYNANKGAAHPESAPSSNYQPTKKQKQEQPSPVQFPPLTPSSSEKSLVPTTTEVVTSTTSVAFPFTQPPFLNLPKVEITFIDRKNEYAVIQNNSNEDVQITNWRLHSYQETGQKVIGFKFPEYLLKKGDKITVWSGRNKIGGSNGKSSVYPTFGDLWWTKQKVWGNSQKAVLLDHNNQVVSSLMTDQHTTDFDNGIERTTSTFSESRSNDGNNAYTSTTYTSTSVANFQEMPEGHGDEKKR